MRNAIILVLPLFLLAISNAYADQAKTLNQLLADLAKTEAHSAAEYRQMQKILETARYRDHVSVPEAARRHMARGEAAVELAKDGGGYTAAIKEFKAATRAAPWFAAAHYNLGIVQNEARQFDHAIKSLKLYLLAAPDAEDRDATQALIYKMEFRKEQAGKGPEIAPLDKVMYARSAANLRSGPGTAFDIVGRAYRNKPLKITGHVLNSNWYRTETENGSIAYIFGSLLSPHKQTNAIKPPRSQQKAAQQPAGKWDHIASSVWCRQGHRCDGSKSQPEAGWCWIAYDEPFHRINVSENKIEINARVRGFNRCNQCLQYTTSHWVGTIDNQGNLRGAHEELTEWEDHNKCADVIEGRRVAPSGPIRGTFTGEVYNNGQMMKLKARGSTQYQSGLKRNAELYRLR